MCRCYICDSVLNEVQFNRDHGDIDPCPTCLEEIDKAFDDFVETEDEEEDIGE